MKGLRPTEIPRRCDHFRCTWALRISTACMIGAFLALAWLLILPSLTAIAVGGVLLTGGFGAQAWSKRPPDDGEDDLMAVADAVREIHVPSYVPDEWVKENGK